MDTQSPESTRLVEQARSLIAEGKHEYARICLDLSEKIDGTNADLRALLSDLALAEGRPTDARLHLDTGLAVHPHDVGLLRRRARQHTEAGEPARAIMDLSEAFLAAPKDYDILTELGETLSEAKLYDQAALYLKMACDVAFEAGNVTATLDAQFRLALAMDKLGATDAALEIFQAIVSVDHSLFNARANVIRLLWRLDRREEAAGLAQEEINRGSRDENFYVMVITWLNHLNRRDAVTAMLEEAARLFPTNSTFAHLAAGMRGDHVESAPNDYIEGVFDSYAESFEKHLLGGLVYRGPGVMARHVEHNLPPSGRFRACLDLGCGTGLMAFVLREIVDRLVGVDISAKMLEEAAEKSLYDELVKDDIKADVKRRREGGEVFDLITAADVFLYLGALEETCADTATILSDEGLLIFTVEHSREDADYILTPTGRFAYRKDYLERCLAKAGFSHVAVLEDQLRMEGSTPVEHLVAIASKTRAITI
ncbi:MAG: hypothetical protein RLY86_170 [Pseudomonadota bacterium]|jgi:predicted TPR repeat methyltransferase